ncbi:MAG: type IX secretion system membrane protein PorP/SprF [Bacteroidales bacterium]|nr:type IX secretion system membrane protein PorP/SprF [Bacteroidales bacterium]
MKRLFITFIIANFSFLFLKSQQVPLYSIYLFNNFLLNPGITGSVDYFPIRLTIRQQWVGIKDAPSTQVLSAHYLLTNQNIGVGGFIFNDKFGPISETGLQANCAYHLPLEGINSKLGIGLAFKAFQFKFDKSNAVLIDADDATVDKGITTKFVPDADFGAYLYNEKLNVGLSATQIIQMKLNVSDSSLGKNQLIRHYYLFGGYKIPVSETLEVEPSLLIKGTFRTPWQIDINTRVIYNNQFWGGLSYRTSKDLIIMLGVKYQKFYVGYAFDYTFSSLNNYSKGSHEVLVGFNVFEGKQKGSTLL